MYQNHLESLLISILLVLTPVPIKMLVATSKNFHEFLGDVEASDPGSTVY